VAGCGSGANKEVLLNDTEETNPLTLVWRFSWLLWV
jgi:hypothetical protein